MARLIDAEKLLTRVYAVTNSKGQVTWSAVSVMDILVAPVVDAVEVVRCRDCKYWGSGKYCESYCNRYGNMMTDINPDDFCSYGERKVGDGHGC